ncbi:hypothetical protein PQX77_022397 [Marasmius sp. AFHP31]|nr:hypothetical protein PQX77_022397 [Marasmius sp. AFHP31]
MSHNDNPSPTPWEQLIAPDLPGNTETYWSYQPANHSYHVHTNPAFPNYATIMAEQFPSGSGGIMAIPELKDSSKLHEFCNRYQAYLETQGIADILTETPTALTADGYKEWKLKNKKATGIFKARFESLITDKIKETLQAFETAFGQEDTAQLVNLYAEFNVAQFHPNSNPLPATTRMDQIRKDVTGLFFYVKPEEMIRERERREMNNTQNQ